MSVFDRSLDSAASTVSHKTHESPVSPENMKAMTKEQELKHAFAFRIELEDAPSVHNLQVELINLLRSEESGLLAFGEGNDTVLGFFWTPKQFASFKEIVSRFHGSYGIGASYGDSQITAVGDDLGEIAYVATCEATNAAARAQKKDELSGRTEDLAKDMPIYGYRYSILQKKNVTEAEKLQLEKGVTDGSLVVGKKGTVLERFEITTQSEFFAMQNDFNAEILAGLSQFPTELIKPIDFLTETEIKLQNVSELSILSFDVNGFSRDLHQLTLEWLAQQAVQDDESAKRAYASIREYRHKISQFFATLESTTRSLVLTDGLSRGINREELLGSIKAVDWRGDAGGMIVPSQFEELLLEALTRTLWGMEGLDVKATIRKHQNLALIGGLNRKVYVPKVVDDTDYQLVKIIEAEKIDMAAGQSIVVRYKDDDSAEVKVFERDKVTGEMRLHLTILHVTIRAPRD